LAAAQVLGDPVRAVGEAGGSAKLSEPPLRDPAEQRVEPRRGPQHSADTAILETSGLPPAAAGEVYQAWIRAGEAIAPSSVFVLDRVGNGVAAIPQGISGADEVMVTREPAGGSQTPTSPLLLRAPLD